MYKYLTINSNSDIKNFNRRELKDDEKEKLYIPPHLKKIERNIVEIDGKYYYAKVISSGKMINELIGSYLSNLIGLNAVDYQIGLCDDTLYALSELFYDENHIYPRFNEYFSETEKKQDDFFKSPNPGKLYLVQPNISKLVNDEELASKILKLTALDLKMEQTDRHSENVMLKKCIKTGKLDLVPIYDFANSYFKISEFPEKYVYSNPFMIIRKNKLSLGTLHWQNPQIIKSAKILIDTPIEDVLSEIEKEKHITIPDETKKFYKEKDKQYTKVLRKI